MKKISILLFFIFTTQLIFAQYIQAPAGGSGTANDPYQISTLGNLNWIKSNSDNLNKHYIQTVNIDAMETSGWNGGEGWEPIGSLYMGSFTGTYDGTGHTINNLYISRPTEDRQGLFGNATNCTIKNLGVINAYVSGDMYIGTLVGSANSCTIDNCYSTGEVANSTADAGGLLGMFAFGNLSNCYNECNVTTEGYAGGIAGYIYDSDVSNCNNSGTITSTGDFSNNTGGLTAYIYGNSTMRYCFNTGNVSGGSYNGGIAGSSRESLIEMCYNSGDISGENYIGGIIGAGYSDSLYNSYATGDMTGIYYVGGLYGYSSSTDIENCYSSGGVSFSYSGHALIGMGSPASISGCFWDKESSGITTSSSAGTGKTTAEMINQSTFTNAGWDFSTTWELIPGNYPRLQAIPDPDLLPVELISFEVKVSGNALLLKWETATEVNNYGFEIERRPETGDWQKVGFVDGAGNSNVVKSYSFIDNLNPALNLNPTLLYRLKQIDVDGSYEYSDVVEVTLGTSLNFSLEQNFPNPFNPVTNISYNIPEKSFVNLTVYDLLGKKVTTLVNKQQQTGNHTIKFDASNLTSGIYIYQLKTDNGFSAIKKLMLLK